MTLGRARKNDRNTSKAAAKVNQPGRQTHCDMILALFGQYGSMSHQELAVLTLKFTQDHRVRCNDLVERGHLRALDKPRIGVSGREQTVWAITPKGKRYLKDNARASTA